MKQSMEQSNSCSFSEHLPHSWPNGRCYTHGLHHSRQPTAVRSRVRESWHSSHLLSARLQGQQGLCRNHLITFPPPSYRTSIIVPILEMRTLSLRSQGHRVSQWTLIKPKSMFFSLHHCFKSDSICF